MTFGTEKLEWWVYLVVKNVFKMFTRFDRIHERDGQTDTGTDTAPRHRLRLCTASRGKNGESSTAAGLVESVQVPAETTR